MWCFPWPCPFTLQFPPEFSHKTVQLKVLPPLQVNLYTTAREQPWKVWKVWISAENKETKLLCILSVVEFNGVIMQEKSCYSIKYNFKAFSSCLTCFLCKKYTLGFFFMIFSLCFMYVYIKEGSSFFFTVIQTYSRILPIANLIIMEI